LRPNFNFNAQNGQVTFTPNVFVGGPAADGNDKYVVVGKVTEWRRLPGQGNRRYVVGSVRRDFLVIVINGAGNTVPTPPVVVVPDPISGAVPTNRADTTRITVQTCNYARVLVNFTDPDNLMMPRPNPLQNLTVTYTGGGTIGGTILQNGDIGTFALVNNGTPNPQMRFFFQPSSTFAGQVLRIPLQIADDACPVRGIQTRVIELRIVRGRTAQAVAASNQPNLLSSTTTPGQPTVAVICGGSLSLTGNVVRPDSIREVARNRTVAQTYGYRWEQVRGLPSLPANTTSQNLTVTPNGNSRYRLTITPLQGFGTDGGGCGDTTSILVKVAPRVTNSFDIPRIISSRNNGQNTLPGQTAVPPLTYELSNTTQVPPAKLCNVTWTYQRVKDAQGNNTTDAPVVFSTNVQPTPNEFPVLTTGGQYEFRLTSAVVETATACAPNVRSCPAVAAVRTVEVPELKVPNIITPNGDNLNETFVVRPELQGGKLEIYNRWGRKVEEYSAYNNSWNAEGQPDGVYYYYLTDKGGVKTKGWIEVARNK
jgi:gliding motility-associated-like protein